MLNLKDKSSHIIAQKLLNWYGQNARILPWRIPPNSSHIPNPYYIWLSEIMLQQTQVVTVIDYFLKFIALWPNVEDLAAASEDAVMHAWAGLGYYSRARNLHKCAKQVVNEYGGEFPQDEKTLQNLPGIGPYTSAAIASIAYGQKANVIDGNIERVMSRLLKFDEILPKEKKKLLNEIEGFIPERRAGDYAQALMDLGATICTPKKPRCDACPLSQNCLAYQEGCIEAYPKKAKRKKIPHKFGYLYLLENSKGEIAIEKRGEKEMLGGLYGFPTSVWEVEKFSHEGKYSATLDKIELTETMLKVEHVFTHFKLTLRVVRGCVEDGFMFVNKETLNNYGFSKLMQKAFIYL